MASFGSVVLFYWGVLCAIAGVVFWVRETSAVREIEAGLALLMATISIGLSFVVEAIIDVRNKLTANSTSQV